LISSGVAYKTRTSCTPHWWRHGVDETVDDFMTKRLYICIKSVAPLYKVLVTTFVIFRIFAKENYVVSILGCHFFSACLLSTIAKIISTFRFLH
jgi:hypothetical protein